MDWCLRTSFPMFLVVGAVSTAGHYLIMIGLVQQMGAEPVLSASIGFTAGAIVNYLLNYTITFRSRRPHRSAIPRFAVTAVTGLLLNALLVAVGVHGAGLHYVIAQVIATGLVVAWSYIINKLWTFSHGRYGD